jgi:acyl dehydratase
MQDQLESQFHMSQQAIDDFGALIGKRVPALRREPGTGHHSDPEAAKSVGLRGPVGFSLHYYAHISHLMLQHFGPQWTDGGEMSIAFIKPVCAGDDIVVKIGERPVQRPEPVPAGRTALQADVFNQLGELVAAGTVSVVD